MSLSRRQFVQRTAVTAGFTGLARYLHAQGAGRGGARGAGAGGGTNLPELQPYLNEVEGYGPLVADPKQIMDLPKGFSYRVLSRAGDRMDDGFRVPAAPDGMATFPAPNGRVILIRNHEVDVLRPPHEGPYGYELELLSELDPKYVYDFAKGRPHFGGTTTIVYNPATGRIEKQFLSLTGTVRNCAGGATPWRSWLTCEESVEAAGEVSEKNHGYVFEVPATTEAGVSVPVPLKDMGRFYHEAVTVDPRTSIVYETEDRNDGLVYRFIPKTPGMLAAGGRLQVLTVRDKKTFDTRNYAETGAPRMPVGEPLAVRWIDIDNADSMRDDLRTRGAALGAAVFARGEGIAFGNDEVYISCTNGGLGQRGQVFKYIPSPAEGSPGEETTPGTLVLFLEPNNAHILESCDNVGVAPWGDLILCEDNAAPTNVVARYGAFNFIRGVTPGGKLYTLGRNRYPGGSEVSGACFAPNHPTMFVNIQAAGMTLAITGPWESRKI